LGTLVIFAVLGPPIGHLVFVSIISSFALQYLTVDRILSDLRNFLGYPAFLASYVFGLPWAALVGAIVVALKARQSRLEALWIVLVGLGVGISVNGSWFALLSLLLGSPSPWLSEVSKPYNLFVWTLTCLVPTLSCWAIVGCRGPRGLTSYV
jgi:hypothetical protein